MADGRREQSYLGGPLQKGLFAQFAFYWLRYIVLVWFGLYLLDAFIFDAVEAGGGLPMSWESYTRFCQQNAHLLFALLLISPILLWNVFQLTHRVAGPLERFRGALEQLRRGIPVEPLTLRRDDLLVEYQYAFNRYLAALELNEDPTAAQTADELEVDVEELVAVSRQL